MLPLNLSCHHHLGPFALSCQLNRLSSKYCCFEGNENFAFSREKELRRTKIFHSLKIRYGIYCCHFWYKYQWALDQFIIFLLSLQKCQAVLYYMLMDKQILEKVFCSIIVPSLSSFMSPGKEHLPAHNQNLVGYPWKELSKCCSEMLFSSEGIL